MSNVSELAKTYERLARLDKGPELLAAYYAESGAAYAAFLSELIPCDGEWFKPKANRRYLLQHDSWGHTNAREMPDSFKLFDHGFLLRKRGFKGITTWENSALIGQPYKMPSRDIAGLSWLRERGVTVWGRPDLSLWNPGATCLLIAAKELKDIPAQAFGFQQLT